jgi:iron complex transport system permease protein
VRPYYGYDPGRILVPSAAGGAALLTFADVLVRVVPANGELKTGVVTSLVGVPFFLYLLLHLRVRGALSGVQA